MRSGVIFRGHFANRRPLFGGCRNGKDRARSRPCTRGFRVSEPAPQDAVPPHDRAGDEHHSGKQADDDVGNPYAHAAVAPEMHAHEPGDEEISLTLAGELAGWFEVIDDADEGVREPE